MIRILLVEDDDDHAHIATRVLTRRPGWQVTRAGTLGAAMDEVDQGAFDVAIVDYRLPDGTGIQLLDRLRAQRPGLPILFFTAHGSEEIAMEAMSRGATDYLVKGPDYVTEIAARVEDTLARAGGVVRVTASPGGKTRSESDSSSAKPPSFNKDAINKTLKTLVSEDLRGIAVFDAGGNPLAAMLPHGVESADLGRAVVGLQSHAQHTLRKVPDAGPPRALLIHHSGGYLAVAAVPGPLLVAILFPADTTAEDALRTAHDAATNVWEASRV